MRGRTYKNPMYPISQWCQHERLRQELPRTNNRFAHEYLNLTLRLNNIFDEFFAQIATVEKTGSLAKEISTENTEYFISQNV